MAAIDFGAHFRSEAAEILTVNVTRSSIEIATVFTQSTGAAAIGGDIALETVNRADARTVTDSAADRGGSNVDIWRRRAGATGQNREADSTKSSRTTLNCAVELQTISMARVLKEIHVVSA